MFFLEVEAVRLSRLAADIWYPHSAHPGDLPPGINTSCVTRAVNTHALVLPLRYNAPRVLPSFSVNMFCAILDSNKLTIYNVQLTILKRNLVRSRLRNCQLSIVNFSLSTRWHRTEARETIKRHPLAISMRYRNIDLLSIGYAFRPGLRTD